MSQMGHSRRYCHVRSLVRYPQSQTLPRSDRAPCACRAPAPDLPRARVDTVQNRPESWLGNTAYVLKESFGQLWSYEREGWARRFFENWRASLKWQRLKPYEKFAEMIDRHWDGIAGYCRLKNKVSLGFVEGLNNKIRVIQRRAGLRNEDYLRLKVLTCMLPAL
jgi:transposase